MANDDTRERDGSGGEVRDFARQGDVGEGGHSAFGHGGEQRHNDERLAGRGRNPGREDGSFLDEPADDRADDEADEARGAGPGVVRGLTPPHRDEIGG